MPVWKSLGKNYSPRQQKSVELSCLTLFLVMVLLIRKPQVDCKPITIYKN